MPNANFSKNSGAILLAAIASAYPVIGFGAPAARVDFTTGNVTAVGANGKSRALTRGAQVEQGETIATNNGRAQLRFTDGAYVSLQPQSEFRIDQYRFDGKQDGNEKGFFSLVKGGLRTITGLVGRNNKNNYQVTTSVATIGIRGTEYTIQYGQSVTGTVGEGEINVCNGAGCLSVMNGESYYVQNDGAKPVLTNKRTDLPPPPPQSPPPEFKEGEAVSSTGEPCSLAPEQCGFVTPLTGTLALDSNTIDFCDGVCLGTNTAVTITFDSSGKLTEYGGTVPSSVKMAGNDGVVAWGTFMDYNGPSVLTHFVAGLPVPTSDFTALGGTVGTYSLLGSPTDITNSNNDPIGQLKSAFLTVNFGVPQSGNATSSVTGSMAWILGGVDNSASLSGGGVNSALTASGNCGGSCSVTAYIALFGPNASRAGMVYKISDINLEALGAAALTKK